MNMIPADDNHTDSERTTLLVAYVLHIIAPFTFWTAAIVGVIIDHLKVNETRSEFIRSHHQWLIRTFWWGLIWLVVTTALMLILIGYVLYIVVAVWWLYRVIRGVLAFIDRRSMPA